MKHIVKKNWVTGGNKQIDFYDLLRLTRKYVQKGSKIFIGSDSFISRDKVCFASAVCLHGGEENGRYFFFKDFLPKPQFSQLVTRITEETRRSVEIACLFMNEYGIDPQILNAPKNKFISEETSEYHKNNISNYPEHQKIMQKQCKNHSFYKVS